MSREPATKRKRFESTRSQASGISALSDITRSTDDLNDADDRFAVTPRYMCNGALRGSRTDVVHAVQPQINFDSQIIPTENRRQRQVSFGLSDEDEETFVKQIESQSYSPQDYKSDRQDQSSPQFPAVEMYARRQIIPKVSVAPLTCQNRRNTSQTSVNNYTLPEHHEVEDELRMKIEEQQRTIDHLLKKDRINTQRLLHKQKVSQRRSVSVTSLSESPKEYVAPVNENIGQTHHLYESLPRNSQTNIPAEANMNNRNESVFVFPSRRNAKIAERRSRSCDVLLNDEENDTFISPPNTNSIQVESSVGYEHVTAHSSAASLNRIDDYPDQEKSSHTKHKRFNFHMWFYVLLALNVIIVLMNATGIPVVLRALSCPHPAEEIICIKCESLNDSLEYIDKTVFMKHNDKCCLESPYQLIELFVNATKARKARHLQPQASTGGGEQDRDYNKDDNDTPVAQYKALGQEKIGGFSRIVWDKEEGYPIQRVFGKLAPGWNNTVVRIPVSGVYYIYSRVNYNKRHSDGEDSVSFGHSILIERSNDDDQSESVEETCFPRTHVVRHTSFLSFVQNLTMGDGLYVRLDKDRNFDIGHSKFGLFLIKNVKKTPK